MLLLAPLLAALIIPQRTFACDGKIDLIIGIDGLV